MDWGNILTLIITTIASSGVSIVGSIFYFRPKLRKANAEAKEIENRNHQVEYDFQTNRIKELEDKCEKAYLTIAEKDKKIDELQNSILGLKEKEFENAKERMELVETIKALQKLNKIEIV